MTLALLLTAVGGAWADELSESFTTNHEVSVYTGEHFKITVGDKGSGKGFYLDETKKATIEALNGEIITKVEFTKGYYYINNFYCEVGTTNISGDVATVSGVNNTSLTFTASGALQIKAVKVYFFTEPAIEVTTNAAEEGATFTEASFEMPTSDVDVDYELVRDMQDETNPVAFSGLPVSGNIVVKKGSDGKYQPAEALTIQLIDPLAAAEAQNIIAADGITVKVLVGAENEQGAIDYDQDNPITLEAFLADMTPGYYWIKAEPTDENSPYDGTVYSSQFTLVEQYDLTVKPADDFSKGKIDAVTVGSETVTPDATTGEVTKTGIAPDTEVKLKAKRGYVIEKVEAKKTSTPN